MAIAFLVAARTRWAEAGWSQWLTSWHFAESDFAWISGPAGAALGIALVLGIAALLDRAGRSAAAQKSERPA